MDQKQLTKQMIEWNKTAVDSTFATMDMLQDQTERMVNLYLDQATWLPKEGKKGFTDWLNACKKGNENFKKMMDDGFKTVESIFA